MSVEELAGALLHVMVEIRGESKAMLALLEFRAEWSAKRVEFRNATRRHIARTLSLRSPQLPREMGERMAVVLLYNMKAMKALVADHGGVDIAGAAVELRDMTRL